MLSNCQEIATKIQGHDLALEWGEKTQVDKIKKLCKLKKNVLKKIFYLIKNF